MTEVPALFTNFARRVLQREAGEAGNADQFALALERACTKLHDSLAPLISSLGFHMLVRRALNLAARDFPFLVTLHIVENVRFSFHGLRETFDGRDPNDVVEGLAAILAYSISLIVIFIGENLGLRKVREIWPEISLHEIRTSSEKVEQ
jgi:hypothetical protein